MESSVREKIDKWFYEYTASYPNSDIFRDFLSKEGILLIPKAELEGLVKKWNESEPNETKSGIPYGVGICANQLQKLIDSENH